ncbi:hypothetical protein EXIGLDRAFT_336343 [Exidia glandulosa HHB12029]|uniref:Uncharacterized protein n=1 Tax=Exidia glandulosa HHB12029 TaxID=1314781 RepID=A0A165CLM4_EXIGL|nr:hypothetical protein EXIGLDRAFT_336343 [Exidia glandulosa HHB12029]
MQEEAQPATSSDHLSKHSQMASLPPTRAQQQQLVAPQVQRTRQSQLGSLQTANSAAHAQVLHAPMQQQQQPVLPALPLPLPPAAQQQQQQQQYMSSPLLPMQRHVQYFEPGYHTEVQWSDGNPFDAGMVQDSPSTNRYITDAFDRPAPVQDDAQSQSGFEDDEDDDEEEELAAPNPDNAPLRKAPRKRKELQASASSCTRRPTKCL